MTYGRITFPTFSLYANGRLINASRDELCDYVPLYLMFNISTSEVVIGTLREYILKDIVYNSKVTRIIEDLDKRAEDVERVLL